MRIFVTPSKSLEEVMFRWEDGTVYWKPWWRSHLHAIRLIFQGHDVEYSE